MRIIMIRFIGSDIDGTILKKPWDTLPDELFELIHFFTSKGVLFTVASGRQYANLRNMFKSVADEVAFITENGALVYYHDEEIHKCVMDHEKAVELSNLIQSLDGYDVQVSVPGYYYMNMKEEPFKHEVLSLPGMTYRTCSDYREITEDIVKVAMYHFGGVDEKLCEDMAREWGKYFTCVRSQKTWFDFIPPEANKGLATKAILDRFGIDRKDAYAFGDNYNDKEMLEYVGHGYIMDIAVPELKAQFENVTDDTMREFRKLKDEILKAESGSLRT